MEEIDKQKLSDLREAFDMFDKDRDGSITTKELGNVVKMLNNAASDQEIKDMIDEVDIDGNGKIEFDEFVVLMGKKSKEQDTEDEVINAFRVFDKDGNDTISSTELRHIMTTIGDKLTDDEVDAMISEADIDGDGTINYVEFVRMMMAK